MQNISYNIRNLRKERGMTQEDLADALHVTRQAVSSWERGNSCPDFETLKLLCEILSASPEQLLYRTETTKTVKHRKVRYFLPVLCSLIGLLLLGFTLQIIGIAIFFALLIPICTAAIIDEVRNKEFYLLHPDGYYDDDEEEHDPVGLP